MFRLSPRGLPWRTFRKRGSMSRGAGVPRAFRPQAWGRWGSSSAIRSPTPGFARSVAECASLGWWIRKLAQPLSAITDDDDPAGIFEQPARATLRLDNTREIAAATVA